MTYKILLFLVRTIAMLPLWVLYRLSDLLYFLVYYVVRYRRRLVRRNLTDSFPTRSAAEITAIEKRFYAWFCDYLVETIKLFSISPSEMRRRMRIEGIEQADADVAAGRSVTLLLGHYCNWEWFSSYGLNDHSGAMLAQLYHTLESPVADRLFLYARGRGGVQSLEMKAAFQILLGWKRAGKQSITGYIIDQSPGFHSMHYWPMFLNHDTPAYTGAERIARVLDTTVYYIDISRPQRGYYVARMVKMCHRTHDIPKFLITENFYRLLEQSIQAHPEFWLWSHNRWKRTRADFNATFDEAERTRILSKL